MDDTILAELILHFFEGEFTSTICSKEACPTWAKLPVGNMGELQQTFATA
jgi:hypothetical protein